MTQLEFADAAFESTLRTSDRYSGFPSSNAIPRCTRERQRVRNASQSLENAGRVGMGNIIRDG
jgi:hypothetical protein